MDDEDSYIHEGLEMSRGRRPVCLLLPVSRVAESASSFDAQERRARRRRRTVGPAVDPEKERRHAVGGIERRFFVSLELAVLRLVTDSATIGTNPLQLW
jgi:hypothetical protein